MPLLFRITVSLESEQGDTATVSAIVMAHRLNEERSDGDFLW